MSKSSSFTNLGVLKKERKAGSQANLKKQTHDPYIVDSRLRIDIKIQSYQYHLKHQRFQNLKIRIEDTIPVQSCLEVFHYKSRCTVSILILYNPAKFPDHFTENKQKNTPTPPFPATGTRNLNSMGPKALWGAGIGSAPGAPLSETAVGHGVVFLFHNDEWLESVQRDRSR